VTCAILLMVLLCNPTSGFKPICDCADMNGQWTTERQLFENGELTNHSEGINMSIQMNECGAQGTLGKGGRIFNAYFAGGVANNLIGKWSMGGDEGTFNIQLQNNEKDCASFAGKMYSGWNYSGKNWLWTGYKEAIGSPQSCDVQCSEHDPHLHWNGRDEYPCGCVCESGYQIDTSGKNCIPIQNPNGNPPDNASSLPSGSAPKSSAGSVEIEITRSQVATTLKAGDHTIFELGKGDDAVINAICEKALYKIGLIQLIYGDTKFSDWPAIIQYNLVNYVSILGVFCQKELPTYSSSFDIASSNYAGGSNGAIKLELQQGPIRAEVLNDQVNLDIETPNVIVSSQGKNAFGVAYDPTSKKSYVAAYQYRVQVQPADGTQAPFTLESGQEVEVGNGQETPATPPGQTPGEMGQNPGFVPEGSEGGCYADPVTGKIVCVDASGKPKESNVEMYGGCYRDPYTGQYVCVDSYGEPSNQQGAPAGRTQGQGSQSEGALGLCFEDPETGEIICSDSGGEASNAEGGMQGECYQDPATGQYVCMN
jgi:hypothetical protein